MKTHRFAWPIAVALAVSLAPSRPALAADPPPAPASVDADDRAAKWLSAGNRAFKEGKFAEAESAYREAWALKPGYDIAGNLGVAELAQGKRRAAAQHLAFTLRMFPITGDPAAREQMQKAFDEARQGVGALRVDAFPKGAQILLDGELVGEAPLADDLFVDPGQHLVEARLAGHRSAAQRVDAAKGALSVLTLALEPLPKPKAVTLPVAPAARRPLAPAYVMGGVTAAGLGTGIALLALASGQRADAEALSLRIKQRGGSCVPAAQNHSALCGELANATHRSDTLHDVAIGALVVGGAAAAGFVTYLVWPQGPRDARARSQRAPLSGPTLSAAPIVGASAGGLVVSGSF